MVMIVMSTKTTSTTLAPARIRRKTKTTSMASMLTLVTLAIHLLISLSSSRNNRLHCQAFSPSSHSSSTASLNRATGLLFHPSHIAANPSAITTPIPILGSRSNNHGWIRTTFATTAYPTSTPSSSSSTSLHAAPTTLHSNPLLLQSSLLLPFIHQYPLLHKPILALSTLAATIAGGIFSGSLHAISGPDHLAALVPRCVGLPWHRAARIGAVWGVGHGASATLLGLVGFVIRKGLKGSFLSSRFFFSGGGDGQQFDVLHHAGSFMELAIGISLIVIGLVGLIEAREWHPSHLSGGDDLTSPPSSADDAFNNNNNNSSNNHISITTPPMTKTKGTKTTKRAVLFNGMLHGFSWDGAPSLAPAVAISSFTGSLTFLLSYALGTTAAMGLATALIGEGTRRAAGKLERPNLPRDLSVGSSVVAMGVGVVWCFLALR